MPVTKEARHSSAKDCSCEIFKKTCAEPLNREPTTIIDPDTSTENPKLSPAPPPLKDSFILFKALRGVGIEDGAVLGTDGGCSDSMLVG